LIDSEVFVGNPEAEVSKWEIPKFAVEHVGNRRLILRRAPYENRLAFVEIVLRPDISSKHSSGNMSLAMSVFTVLKEH
jgi:hypothetical protein